ncbi:MAG: ATP synthase F0 subunit B [Desulfobacterales bacterium]|nr:ATP synthase F0 subunit B [Desulfobacterales bacterium]
MNAFVTLRKRYLTAFCITAVLLLGSAGAVMAAGGGGSHWQTTDTYKLMNFTVLAIGLFFLLKKPVSQALNARIDGIKDQLGELETQKKAAEDELAKYNEKLATLEDEAETIVAEYVRQGEEAKTRILAEAEKAAEKLEEQAKKNITAEFKQAKADLQAEIIDKALIKAEEIIKSKISDDDQVSLVDEYLDKVVA